jgi:deazaflavin-dependent oxidoreductase (nitroreductase family)
MRRLLWIPVALVAFLVATAAWWRRHPRFGSSWVNRVVDPWVVREGIVEKSEGEIGLIEHVGRKSGIVRVSPVHPVRTEDGFRIVVPLGLESEWAHNVLTAGRCRLQIGETVYELDEPMLISPMLVEEIPPLVQHMMVWLGFQYLQLHRFAEAPGTFSDVAELPDIVTSAEAEIEPGLVPV